MAMRGFSTLCRNVQAEIRTDEVVNHEKGRKVAIRKPLNPSLSLGGWQRLRRMYGELALALFSQSGHYVGFSWWWQRKWCPNTYALFICLNDVINDFGKTALKVPFLVRCCRNSIPFQGRRLEEIRRAPVASCRM